MDSEEKKVNNEEEKEIDDLQESDFEEDDSLRVIDYRNVGMSFGKKMFVFFFILLVAALLAAGAYFADQKGFFDKYKKTPQVSIESIKDVDLESVAVKGDSVDVSEDSKDGESDKNGDDQKKNEDKKDDFKANKKVEILALNGGGGSGAAGKMQSFLSKNGYENVDAKNASEFDHKSVEIYYANDKLKEDAKAIGKVVEEQYSGVEVSKAKEGDEKLSDIVVIVGAK